MQSFYWYDFETFGVNPQKDRPAQFAGVRTDFDFNIIDEPLNIFCKPADDFIPHPEACLVTGITPQQALQQGVDEREFFRQIHNQLSVSHTCALGYNNIRFDDEVIRFGLYRNFYDAYAREWQNGNSRWDLLDLMRMTHALRPDGVNWPVNSDGHASFRLEELSAANGISHDNAHDALADVYATIEMARLVKSRQPRLFNYLLALRDKKQVMAEIDLINLKPFIHCSGMLGPDHAYCGVMMPLVAHPTNKNSVICVDLSRLEEELSGLSAADLTLKIFTRQEDLPTDVMRLPIKEIHYNKCPAVAPLGVLNQEAQARLGIDLEDCLQKADLIRSSIQKIQGNLLVAYQPRPFNPICNPDHALYSGGFFGSSDKHKMETIRRSDWNQLAHSQFQFDDPRLAEMLFRYRARNAPESLSLTEKQRWIRHQHSSFFDPDYGATLIYADFKSKMQSLDANAPQQQLILQQLGDYVEQLVTHVQNKVTAGVD